MRRPRTPGTVPDRTRPSLERDCRRPPTTRSIRRSSSLACSSASTREPIGAQACGAERAGWQFAAQVLQACRGVSRRAGQAAPAARDRRSPSSAGRRSSTGSASSGSSSPTAVLMSSRCRRNPRTGCWRNRSEIVEVRRFRRSGAGASVADTSGRHCRPRPVGGASPGKPGRVEGERPGLCPAGPAGSCGASNGCSGWRTTTCPGRAHRRPARRPSRRRRRAVRRAVRTAGPRRRCAGRRRCRR